MNESQTHLALLEDEIHQLENRLSLILEEEIKEKQEHSKLEQQLRQVQDDNLRHGGHGQVERLMEEHHASTL